MYCRPSWLIALAFLTTHLSVLPARAEDRTDDDVKTIAAKIDRIIEARWASEKVRPSAPSEDSIFLRRVSLDLTGRIPSLTAARDFMDDPDPDKRLRLVDKLLKTKGYARHFAAITRKVLLADANVSGIAMESLDEWMEKRLLANLRYDSLAREVVTAPIAGPGIGSGIGIFYQTNEYKPENLAANASRVFLGIRLECAQCHDHPFASYKRKDFWEFAAFFSGVGRTADGGPPKLRAGEITIPMSGKVVQARLPGEAAPMKPSADPRIALADWLGKKDNPYFAKAIVNRLWGHFFGLGIVEPLDEMGEQNPASHPEVLDELSKTFVAHDYDLRYLMRVIVATRAYQLSSLVCDPPQASSRLFARMAVRGMSAEQLYDSVGEAIWKVQNEKREMQGTRSTFLGRFASQERAIDPQTSILQALHLMNGKPLADAISFENNRALRTLAEVKGRSTAECVEELYLMTLTRKPRTEETARFVKYIDGGGPRRDRKKALSDVLWALLNSPEFMLNH